MTGRYYSLEDSIWFEAFIHNPSGGALINADETPRWSVYEEGSDTPIQEDNFRARTGLIGSYIGNFVSSGVTGFETNKFYSVHASGRVNNIVGRAPVQSFVIDDIYDSNTIQVSGDGFAAGNLRDQFNGTGITDDTYPSTQSQVESFAVGSAAVSKQAESYLLTTGTQSANTVSDTETADGIEHQHTDVGNAIELYYQFDIGGNGIATEAQLLGRLNSNNDSINVFAFDWGNTTWDQIGILSGQASSINTVHNYNLLVRHTGAGASLGKVRIRFQVASGLTSATLSVDQIFTSYSIVTQSVGYSNGSVWIDTVGGTAGTESFVNGVADNPVLTLTDAITLATNVGLSRFQVINGSSLTFGETHSNETWNGTNWSLQLNNQDISNTFIDGAQVEGTGISTINNGPQLTHCDLGVVTLNPCRIDGASTFSKGPFKLASSGDYLIIDCNSSIAGSGTPDMDLLVAGGPNDLSIRGWQGGLTFDNISADDKISLEGIGGLVNVGGTGGSFDVRGIFELVTDNSSASVSIIETASLSRASLALYDAGIWVNTNISNTSIINYVDGTSDNPVSTWAAALSLSASLGITDFHIINGSSIILTGNSENYSLFGDNWTLGLGIQACGGIYVQGATVSGVGTSSGQEMHFEGCDIGIASIQQGHFDKCGFNGTLTMTTTDNYDFHNCYSKGSVPPVFTKTAGQTIIAEFQNYAGDITVSGLQSGDTIELGGFFRTIVLNGADATVHVHGHYEIVTNNLGSPVSVTGAIKTQDVADILIDTNEIGIEGSGLTSLGGMSTGMTTEVENAVWDANLSGHTTSDTTGSAVQDTYFSNIKFVKDAPNTQDEYTVSWYKNGDVLSSGDLSNPAISVYNTVDGSAKFENQTLDFISAPLAVVRYNETTAANTLPSGEPFVVVTSGIIGGATRTWKLAIGLDDI